MKIISKLEPKHILELQKLYQKEWWTEKRTVEETTKVVENSSIVIGLIDEENELKAFGRVLTDYTFKAIVFDVIVEEKFRNRGLGKELIQLIIGHDDLRDIKHFELYCLPEMVEFYEEYGFSEKLEKLVFMRKEM